MPVDVAVDPNSSVLSPVLVWEFVVVLLPGLPRGAPGFVVALSL